MEAVEVDDIPVVLLAFVNHVNSAEVCRNGVKIQAETSSASPQFTFLEFA